MITQTNITWQSIGNNTNANWNYYAPHPQPMWGGGYQIGFLPGSGASFGNIIMTREKENTMRGLYETFIVDPETDEIVETYRLVANDEPKARLKAATRAKLAKDVDEYDIIVRLIGPVRPKPTVQDVRVVK